MGILLFLIGSLMIVEGVFIVLVYSENKRLKNEKKATQDAKKTSDTDLYNKLERDLKG